jgi:hypothetical protein
MQKSFGLPNYATSLIFLASLIFIFDTPKDQYQMQYTKSDRNQDGFYDKIEEFTKNKLSFEALDTDYDFIYDTWKYYDEKGSLKKTINIPNIFIKNINEEGLREKIPIEEYIKTHQKSLETKTDNFFLEQSKSKTKKTFDDWWMDFSYYIIRKKQDKEDSPFQLKIIEKLSPEKIGMTQINMLDPKTIYKDVKIRYVLFVSEEGVIQHSFDCMKGSCYLNDRYTTLPITKENNNI